MMICFYTNVQRILVLMRSNVEYKDNILILNILKSSIEKQLSNSEIAKIFNEGFKMSEMAFPPNYDFFSYEDAETFKSEELDEMLVKIINIIIAALLDGNYEKAYDFIDVIHCIADVFSVSKSNYYKSFLNPATEKWKL